jgi:hypothetical protein
MKNIDQNIMHQGLNDGPPEYEEQPIKHSTAALSNSCNKNQVKSKYKNLKNQNKLIFLL